MENIAHNLLTNLVPRFLTTSPSLLAVYLKKPKGKQLQFVWEKRAVYHYQVSLLIPFAYTFEVRESDDISV